VRKPHRWRLVVAWSLLAATAAGAVSATVLLSLQHRRQPGAVDCTGRSLVTWSEARGTPLRTPHGLLSVRLADRRVSALLPEFGHGLDHPAYRPATEKALETGLFLLGRVARNSSWFRSSSPSAVSLEPLGAGARRSRFGLSASLRPAPRRLATAPVALKNWLRLVI
jgi:hypothetical protein